MDIRDYITDESKDIRINLSNVLDSSYAPGLTENQIQACLLTTLYTLKNPILNETYEKKALEVLSEDEVKAVKSACSIMMMNNIYYRFIHFSEDSELSQKPAKLRMTVIGNPGVDKVDFELYCLVASSLNGCGMCVKSHTASLKKLSFDSDGILSAIRIASVLKAADHCVNLNKK